MGKITIYTRAGCADCQGVKEDLKLCQLPFEEVRLDPSSDNRPAPLIYFNGSLVEGGINELVDILEQWEVVEGPEGELSLEPMQMLEPIQMQPEGDERALPEQHDQDIVLQLEEQVECLEDKTNKQAKLIRSLREEKEELKYALQQQEDSMEEMRQDHLNALKQANLLTSLQEENEDLKCTLQQQEKVMEDLRLEIRGHVRALKLADIHKMELDAKVKSLSQECQSLRTLFSTIMSIGSVAAKGGNSRDIAATAAMCNKLDFSNLQSMPRGEEEEPPISMGNVATGFGYSTDPPSARESLQSLRSNYTRSDSTRSCRESVQSVRSSYTRGESTRSCREEHSTSPEGQRRQAVATNHSGHLPPSRKSSDPSTRTEEDALVGNSNSDHPPRKSDPASRRRNFQRKISYNRHSFHGVALLRQMTSEPEKAMTTAPGVRHSLQERPTPPQRNNSCHGKSALKQKSSLQRALRRNDSSETEQAKSPDNTGSTNSRNSAEEPNNSHQTDPQQRKSALKQTSSLHRALRHSESNQTEEAKLPYNTGSTHSKNSAEERNNSFREKDVVSNDSGQQQPPKPLGQVRSSSHADLLEGTSKKNSLERISRPTNKLLLGQSKSFRQVRMGSLKEGNNNNNRTFSPPRGRSHSSNGPASKLDRFKEAQRNLGKVSGSNNNGSLHSRSSANDEDSDDDSSPDDDEDEEDSDSDDSEDSGDDTKEEQMTETTQKRNNSLPNAIGSKDQKLGRVSRPNTRPGLSRAGQSFRNNRSRSCPRGLNDGTSTTAACTDDSPVPRSRSLSRNASFRQARSTRHLGGDPMTNMSMSSLTSSSMWSVAQGSTDGDDNHLVELPLGKFVTVLEATLELKRILPIEDMKYNRTTYKNSFKGSSVADTFQEVYQYSREEAETLGKSLHSAKMLYHVCNAHGYKDNGWFYRLHCHQTPEVLNSFCVWKDKTTQLMHCSDVIEGVMSKLQAILDACTNADSEDKRIDYSRAAKLGEQMIDLDFAVCELQMVKLARLDKIELLAFGLNAFQTFLHYAFIKVGIPPSSSSSVQSSFWTNLKFNIGGDLFTFHEWWSGVCRGNKKGPYGNRPFGGKDSRRYLQLLDRVDPRIHFAAAVTHFKRPMFVYTSYNLNQELDNVARIYCQKSELVWVQRAACSVTLSPMFQTNVADFASTILDLPKAIMRWLPKREWMYVERTLRSNQKIKVEFREDGNFEGWAENAGEHITFKTCPKADCKAMISLSSVGADLGVKSALAKGLSRTRLLISGEMQDQIAYEVAVGSGNLGGSGLGRTRLDEESFNLKSSKSLRNLGSNPSLASSRSQGSSTSIRSQGSGRSLSSS